MLHSQEIGIRTYIVLLGFPGSTVIKNQLANAGDTRDASSVPGSGRSPEIGNSNPLQYSCLKSSMDRGAWWTAAPGITKSQRWLSMHACCNYASYSLKHKNFTFGSESSRTFFKYKNYFLSFGVHLYVYWKEQIEKGMFNAYTEQCDH